MSPSVNKEVEMTLYTKLTLIEQCIFPSTYSEVLECLCLTIITKYIVHDANCWQ